MKPFLKKVLGAGLFALAISTPVLADPILVTDGTLEIISFGGELLGARMAISGTQGFSLSATSDSVQASCGSGEAGCLPGQVVSHSGTMFTINGTGTLNGATYPFNSSAGFGTLLIEAPSFTLPPPAGFGEVAFETLFGLTTDSFLVFAFSDLDPNPIRLAVAGSGRATSHFLVREEPGFGTLYDLERITYDFDSPAVVPEPASLLLVGSGLAAVCARRRRVRASRRTD